LFGIQDAGRICVFNEKQEEEKKARAMSLLSQAFLNTDIAPTTPDFMKICTLLLKKGKCTELCAM
jgi:hypothetical protein